MISFTPHSEIALPRKSLYGDDYLNPVHYGPQYKAVYLVDYEAIFREIAAVEDDEERHALRVRRYRWLIQNDLFFVGFFVCENRFMNHPFAVNRCHMVKNGPQSDTLDVWARYHLKAVDIDEPVFTPKGWVKHGDIVPGDEVFGPDGLPTKVTAKTPVFTDGDCYQVTFDTGYSVVVSGDHLWNIQIQSRKRIKGNVREGVKSVILDTRKLSDEVEKSKKFKTRVLPRVKIADAVKLPEADLPIHPYALGVWLGDGTNGSACITSALTDADEMVNILRSCGHRADIRKHSNAVTITLDRGTRGKKGSNDFTKGLRSLGILRDKFIPTEYMLSSAMQRWELLQGLMDTDGTIHKSHSQASFCNINKRLANDVHTLACSLGLKASINKFTCLYNGERRPFYQVMFKGCSDRTPFKMARKTALCDDIKARQTRYRRVVNVEPVPFRPVSCISVTRKDGMYLIGKHFVPTHNSSIITQYETIQYIVKDPEMCHCIFSYSKPSAEKFLLGIKEACQKEIMLACFPEIFYERTSDSPSWSLQGGIRVKRASSSRPQHTVQAYGLIEGMPTGGHWDRLIFDDTETEDLARNPDQIGLLKRAFDMAQSCGMPDGTIVRIIGTFYTHCGLLTHLRDLTYPDGDQEKVYLFRKFPATEDGTKNGKLVFMDEKSWRKEKIRSSCNSQYLCDPTPTEDMKLDFSMFKPIEPQFIPKNRLKFIIIDPAGDDAVQTGTKNDMWSIGCISVKPFMDELGLSEIYIEEVVADQMPLNTAIDAAVSLYLRSGRIMGLGIEKVGNDTTYEHIRKALIAQGRFVNIKKSKTDNGNLVLLSPEGRNKEWRVESALSWPLSNSKIFYSTALNPTVLSKMKDECDKFGFIHLDILDMLAYVYKMIETMGVYIGNGAYEDVDDSEETFHAVTDYNPFAV